METKILKFNKFRVEISQRQKLNTFPNHPFQAIFFEETPKGKYAKEKILKNYVYKTFEEATERAINFLNTIETNFKLKEEEKRKRAEANKLVKASDFYQIGDIIVNSWGYEQTNIEFYKIISMTQKTIKIKEIRQKEEEDIMYDHGMACNVLPSDEFLKDGETYTLIVKENGILSNPQSYYYMHKWEGKPQYKSWYY